MRTVNVLLSSAGRRPYLTRWFKNTTAGHGISTRVILADADGLTPGKSDCDEFLRAPRVVDPSYMTWLQNTLADYQIDLALSVNDFELSQWASVIPRAPTFDSLVRLGKNEHRAVEDKFLMEGFLSRAQIDTPKTYLASEVIASETFLPNTDRVVVKGRFGSGSRGLHMVTIGELEAVLGNTANEVTTRDGSAAHDFSDAMDLTVVQQKIAGQEFGIDVVANLEGEFVGVLARRKIAMRGGETDKAVTVDPAPFQEVGAQLSELLGHRGSIDVDVIVDEKGKVWVIDVNPRFGGGYPFSHLAGADLPGAMVSWVSRSADSARFLSYKSGVISAKFVETSVVELSDEI